MMDKAKTFKVDGMSCEHCVNAVNRAVESLDGVSEVNVDLSSKTVTVQYDADKVSDIDIKSAIEDQGYDVM